MVNMNVRSMGPFSEKKEEYAMQLYMRQVWYDSRLRFNKTDLGRSTFSMNWMFAEKIWKPDTFFINGKKSYAHAITAPNMFVRLQHDGQIYMSMRLTVRASCIMHLRRFPLDTQTCPLRLASYGYNAKDIMFEWDPTKMVTVDSDVSIAQYELVNVTFSEAIVPVRRIEKISTLTVKFHLTRLTGFFMLQVYVPCILIVCSSWVGFWITKKDAPGRVCLGVTTVLAMVTLGFGGRNAFPEVAYATALDYFVILCLAFLFAAVIEFACINYLERRANKRRKKMEELKKKIVEQLSTEGAGCIKVTPSIHTSILESFKVHLMVSPAATRAANTNKPRKPDPKGKLLQALKLPLTVVPKVADEADTVKAEMSLDHSHDHHHHHHLPFHLPHHHHHDEATSPHTSSDTESSGSLSPKPYTPRLLQRLAVLQRRLSSHDIHDDKESMPGSQRSSPQPSVEGSPLPSRPPLPPLPPIPGQTPPPGTSVSPPSLQDSPSQTHSIVISGQETPQMSPRISPLTTSAQSALPSPTITTTPPAMVTSAGDPSSGPSAVSPGGESSQAGAVKPEGVIVKVESAGDQPPPPPPAQKHTVTVWQLLIKKKYLMKHMTPTFELPGEEDLLDRFSIIDLYSRRIFPSFFFILFTIYWVLFNYYITDEFPHEPRIPSDGLVN